VIFHEFDELIVNSSTSTAPDRTYAWPSPPRCTPDQGQQVFAGRHFFAVRRL